MTLPDLIARLESASEGSRELDAFIWWENLKPWQRDATDADLRAQIEGGDLLGALAAIGFPKTCETMIPAFSTSIDAALTLVPENRLWSIGCCIKKPGYVAVLSNETKSWAAPTAALAICIAALRAKGGEG